MSSSSLWSRIPCPDVPDKQVELLRQDLMIDACPDRTFVALIVSSCLIASFGLVSNSAAVIIGAMIIAPLMMPIRALAFGALEGDLSLFKRSAIAITLGTGLGVGLSWLLGMVVGIPAFGSEVLARTSPNLIDLGIAVTAGAIAAYAKVQPRLNDALAGTAIAVALMPPLCVVGLTLSQHQWHYSQGALLLYLTNLLGISLACMVMFILLGYTPVEERRTRHVFRIMVGLTTILVIPLTISFSRLLREAQLQADVQQALLRQTITVGQELDLKKLDINWRTEPYQITLIAEAKEPPTINQAILVQEFLRRNFDRSFDLTFRVNAVWIVSTDPATYQAEATGPTVQSSTAQDATTAAPPSADSFPSPLLNVAPPASSAIDIDTDLLDVMPPSSPPGNAPTTQP